MHACAFYPRAGELFELSAGDFETANERQVDACAFIGGKPFMNFVTMSFVFLRLAKSSSLILSIFMGDKPASIPTRFSLSAGL